MFEWMLSGSVNLLHDLWWTVACFGPTQQQKTVFFNAIPYNLLFALNFLYIFYYVWL